MKNPLRRSVSEDFWSEWRGSNSRPPHPKCGALSTALHPDSYSIVVVSVVKSVVRHGFDRYFLFSIPPEICTFKGLSAVATDKRCEHCLCSQTRRDTNFAIPGYSISAMIPRRTVKIKFFLSVVIYVVKAAFVPLSATGGKPAIVRAARICGVLP